MTSWISYSGTVHALIIAVSFFLAVDVNDYREKPIEI